MLDVIVLDLVVWLREHHLLLRLGDRSHPLASLRLEGHRSFSHDDGLDGWIEVHSRFVNVRQLLELKGHVFAGVRQYEVWLALAVV